MAPLSISLGVATETTGLSESEIGPVRVFRILLASQMVVFGVLMTERDPWVFSALVCYALLCLGRCAVERRRLLAGANPARQLSLQPVTIGAGDGGNDMA